MRHVMTAMCRFGKGVSSPRVAIVRARRHWALGLALGAALSLPAAAQAAPTATTWIGDDDVGDWFDNGNWSNGTPNSSVNGKYAVFTGPKTVTSNPNTYPGVNGISFEGTGGFNLDIQPLYVVNDPDNPAFFRVTQPNQAEVYFIAALQNQSVGSTIPVQFEIASGSTLRTSIAHHGVWTVGRYGAEGDGGTLELVSTSNLGRSLTSLTINNNSTFRNYLKGDLPIASLSGQGTLISGSTTGAYNAKTILRANALNFSGIFWAKTTGVDASAVAGGAIGFDVANGGSVLNGGIFYIEANGAGLKSVEQSRGLHVYSSTDANHDMTFNATQINGNGQIVFRWGSCWNASGGNSTLTINDVTLKPGIDNVGILTFYGNLSADDDGVDALRNKLVIEVAGGGAVPGVDYDRLELLKGHSSGGGILTSVGSSNPLANLTVEVRISNALSPESVEGDTLRFLTTLNDLTGASLGEVKVYYGNALLPASAYTLTYGGSGASGFAEVTINAVPIPEPATAFLGSVCGMLLLSRRARARAC